MYSLLHISCCCVRFICGTNTIAIYEKVKIVSWFIGMRRNICFSLKLGSGRYSGRHILRCQTAHWYCWMALQEDFETPSLVCCEFIRWTDSKVMRLTAAKDRPAKRHRLCWHEEELQERNEWLPLLVKTGLLKIFSVHVNGCVTVVNTGWSICVELNMCCIVYGQIFSALSQNIYWLSST